MAFFNHALAQLAVGFAAADLGIGGVVLVVLLATRIVAAAEEEGAFSGHLLYLIEGFAVPIELRLVVDFQRRAVRLPYATRQDEAKQ